MPDRLSDIVNVKDWGATANYPRTNDTPAIQAAINYLLTPPRTGGVVFFPPGSYAVSTLTVGSNNPNAGVQLVGSGKKATHLYGGSFTPPGFMISKQAATYDNIERIEGLSVHGSQVLGCGAIRITANTVNGQVVANNASIINCNVEGAVGIDTSTAVGVFIRDLGQMTGPLNNPPNATPTPGPNLGTVGVYLGTGCTLAECRVQGGMDICYALSGQGASLIAGCAAEVCRTGVRVGWRPNAVTGLGEEAPAIGCTVHAFQTERCETQIDLYNVTGCFIAGSTLTGTSGPYPSLAQCTTLSWNSSTQLVTVTTTHAHHINPVGPQLVMMTGGTPSDYIPPAQYPCGIVVATVTGSNTFTYPGVTVSPASNPHSGGHWTYPLKYGIRCRKVYDTVILGCDFQQTSSIGDVDLECDGAADHRNNTFVACNAGGHGFVLPTTNPRNLSAWKFIATGMPFINQWPPGGVCNPNGNLTFAALPASPLEGMEFDIKDSPIAALGNFGANVTVGGSGNHVKVRFDGSHWKISG
jgi:hypothetical protein